MKWAFAQLTKHDIITQENILEIKRYERMYIRNKNSPYCLSTKVQKY